MYFKNFNISCITVTHSCNPSYSGGRNQEDGGSKPAWANTSPYPISKKSVRKEGWWSGSSCNNVCLASMRPGVQTPILPKRKKKHLQFKNL
jgi:hypothetical protein